MNRTHLNNSEDAQPQAAGGSRNRNVFDIREDFEGTGNPADGDRSIFEMRSKGRPWKRAWIFVTAAIVSLAPSPAMAYIGPGAGLSAFGALLAVVVAVLAAILGFLWYPIKRLLGRFKRAKRKAPESSEP
jgi:hypothetical protein